ncbi:hypothetical protein ACOZ4L_16765 (plasmid) [Haloplanus ruber]|uniref:DUF340 domain-containing protein n=1 Tax=Haloplanus ruber TaxID=869892 RepID=A0ABD6CVT0_9EURY|nr:hypothetical protein [Haloplanus ruber]
MDRAEFVTNALAMLVVVGIITLIGNTVGYDAGLVESIPGIALIIAIGIVSLFLAREIPLELPSFAYAIFIAMVLALPFSPTQEVFLRYTDRISFLATATPILAYAGLSVSLQMDRFKQIGWKLVVVAVFVFFGTFFGSAIIAQAVLSFQGII